MQRTQALVLGCIAALAIAGTPAISGASLIVTAHALHTGVQQRVHLHRGHLRHAHRPRTELRAAPTARATATHSSPAPALPHRRPAHSHAMLPHTGVKLHRTESRGGAPYALGLASLSLGLWTSGESMPVTRNELISDPSSGILKGRSPPRGIPLSATSSPCLARPSPPDPLLRASADPFRACRTLPALPLFTTSEPHSAATCLRTGVSAPRSLELPAGAPCGLAVLTVRASRRGDPALPITPDRASEGGPAGFPLPSWRWFT